MALFRKKNKEKEQLVETMKAVGQGMKELRETPYDDSMFINDDDYGLIAEKPIQTFRIAGSKQYLESLRTEEGKPVTWERKCSLSIEGINGMIDMYCLFSEGAQIATIYLDMYGQKQSKVPPKGFVLEEVVLTERHPKNACVCENEAANDKNDEVRQTIDPTPRVAFVRDLSFDYDDKSMVLLSTEKARYRELDSLFYNTKRTHQFEQALETYISENYFNGMIKWDIQDELLYAEGEHIGKYISSAKHSVAGDSGDKYMYYIKDKRFYRKLDSVMPQAVKYVTKQQYGYASDFLSDGREILRWPTRKHLFKGYNRTRGRR